MFWRIIWLKEHIYYKNVSWLLIIFHGCLICWAFKLVSLQVYPEPREPGEPFTFDLNEIPEIDEISFVVTPSEPETTFEILDLIVHACVEPGTTAFLLIVSVYWTNQVSTKCNIQLGSFPRSPHWQNNVWVTQLNNVFYINMSPLWIWFLKSELITL